MKAFKVIKYIDSNITEEQTISISKPATIDAIGFVIEETDDYITLARELIGEEYRGQISIPKRAIIK